ncbi:MAG: hypothetical protein ABDH34_08355 [Dictyoglomus thermophilum]
MTQEKEVKEIKEEIELLDDMLSALVDLLEEKGVLRYEEWEKKIKEKIKESRKLNRI